MFGRYIYIYIYIYRQIVYYRTLSYDDWWCFSFTTGTAWWWWWRIIYLFLLGTFVGSSSIRSWLRRWRWRGGGVGGGGGGSFVASGSGGYLGCSGWRGRRIYNYNTATHTHTHTHTHKNTNSKSFVSIEQKIEAKNAKQIARIDHRIGCMEHEKQKQKKKGGDGVGRSGRGKLNSRIVYPQRTR